MIRNMLVSLLMLVMSMQMSAAQGLSVGDMAFAFGAATTGAQEPQRVAPAPKSLSAAEMKATEGEWIQIPLTVAVRLGIYGVRFLGPRLSQGRICGVLCRTGPGRSQGYGIRMDYDINPSPTRLHFHFGRLNSRTYEMHRPWYNPGQSHFKVLARALPRVG